MSAVMNEMTQFDRDCRTLIDTIFSITHTADTVLSGARSGSQAEAAITEARAKAKNCKVTLARIAAEVHQRGCVIEGQENRQSVLSYLRNDFLSALKHLENAEIAWVKKARGVPAGFGGASGGRSARDGSWGVELPLGPPPQRHSIATNSNSSGGSGDYHRIDDPPHYSEVLSAPTAASGSARQTTKPPRNSRADYGIKSADLEEELLQEKRDHLDRVFEDIAGVQRLYQTLAEHVGEQGVKIERLESFVQGAADEAEQGTRQVAVAHAAVHRSRRRRMFCFLIMVVALILFIVYYWFISHANATTWSDFLPRRSSSNGQTN
eukprot:Selendium_serpulae@DN2546_c0_g1_i2.p1